MCDGKWDRVMKLSTDGKVLGELSHFGNAPGEIIFRARYRSLAGRQGHLRSGNQELASPEVVPLIFAFVVIPNRPQRKDERVFHRAPYAQ